MINKVAVSSESSIKAMLDAQVVFMRHATRLGFDTYGVELHRLVVAVHMVVIFGKTIMISQDFSLMSSPCDAWEHIQTQNI